MVLNKPEFVTPAKAGVQINKLDARLRGHGTLPMRPEMLKAEPLPAIEDWCEDREIPLRQAEEDEYMKHPLGERRIEWVDE